MENKWIPRLGHHCVPGVGLEAKYPQTPLQFPALRGKASSLQYLYLPPPPLPACEREGGQVGLPAASALSLLIGSRATFAMELPQAQPQLCQVQMAAARAGWTSNCPWPGEALGDLRPGQDTAIPDKFFHVLFDEKGAVFSARGQRRVFQCFLAADPAALWLPGALANGRRVELMGLLATASP